jgi:hypothetical protein
LARSLSEGCTTTVVRFARKRNLARKLCATL